MGQFSDLLVRQQAGGVYTVAGIERVPGKTWYVDSGAAGAGATTAYGRTPDSPFSSVAYAFSSALPASGDVIYVMPGHAETISAAGGITMNIAGVSVIGLGKGTSRPTVTMSTSTAATWLITANNVNVRNVLVTVTGTIDVVSAITVTGTDSLLEDIEVRDSSATSQITTGLILSTTSDRARVRGFTMRSHASGDAAADGILISSAVDGVEIDGGWLDGLFSNACIRSSAAATNTIIRRPILRQRHATTAAAISLHASNTGFVRDPVARITVSTGALSAAYAGAAVNWYNPLASMAVDDSALNPKLAAARIASKASGAITGNPTINVFTVAGGEVCVKRLWLKVTTAIAVNGGTLAVQIHPTSGDTYVIVTATDLGTADTAAGSVVGLDQGTTAASKFLRGGRIDLNTIATTGTIELVGASGVDGAVTIFVEWEPLVAGATLVAS